MGFVPLKEGGFYFQNTPRWLHWLPNVLANGEVQVGRRHARDPEGGAWSVGRGSCRQNSVGQSGGPGGVEQLVGPWFLQVLMLSQNGSSHV